MKVVALISGGKDSCFSMMECVRHGHEIVALANLRPPSPSPSPGSGETARGATDDQVAASEEMDSFMFQTVGVGAICPAIAECMGLPLISRTLRGKSLHQDLDYRSVVGGDEVEDLFALLQEVKTQYPEVNAVCSGAILSNYQRNRVEFVCERLGLTSLSFLWQREQHEVLTSMIESGLEGVLVKIASMGLKPRMLGKPLGTLMADFEELYEQFGFHVCGEGGEYETVTLDCPLFKRRIVIDKSEIVIEDDCSFAPSAHLRICALHTEPKSEDACALTIVPAHYAVRDPASLVAKADDTSTNTTDENASTLVDQGERPLVSQSAKGALVSVQNCVGDPNQTLEEELRGAMANLAEALGHLNLRVDEHVCFVHFYVASMSDFGRVNAEYCKFFESSPAPSRACVQIRLAGGRRVSVSAQATRYARDVLHVRSISSWAPVCIGPYSQANKIDALGSLTFVAGQIALEPAVMEMIAGDEVAQFDKALAHCDAVLKCRDGSLAQVRSAIVYVSSAVTTMEKTDLLARLPREATATLVQIPRLPRDALVEIEVIAAHGASFAQKSPGPRPCAGGKFYVEGREVAGRANEKTSSAEIVAHQYVIYCAANEALVAGNEKEVVTHVDAALSTFGAMAGRVFYLPHEVSSRSIAAGFSSFQSIPCSHLAAKDVKAKNSGVGRVCAVVMATSSTLIEEEEEEEEEDL